MYRRWKASRKMKISYEKFRRRTSVRFSQIDGQTGQRHSMTALPWEEDLIARWNVVNFYFKCRWVDHWEKIKNGYGMPSIIFGIQLSSLVLYSSVPSLLTMITRSLHSVVHVLCRLLNIQNFQILRNIVCSVPNINQFQLQRIPKWVLYNVCIEIFPLPLH